MKIKSVTLCDLKLPPPQGTHLARRDSYNRTARRAYPIHKYKEFPRSFYEIPGQKSRVVWVQVTAENGEWGLGSCKWGEEVAALITNVFAPLVVGRDCMATELLNDLMWRAIQKAGAQGLASMARSAIDLALWDLKGKLLDQPVYALIGGPCREAVDLYCTSDDVDWAMELGFRAFKISNNAHYDEGLEGIDMLEERVAAAREKVGPQADLMINPVMSFNVEYAIRVIERLKPYRLRWVEEPLPSHDLKGLEEIKRAVPTQAIATGESHHGRHVFREMVERRCADVLQPDLRYCGGLTEALKIYAIAEAAGLQTILHSGAGHSGIGTPYGQHFAFALPESPMAEYWLASDPGVPLEFSVRTPGAAYPIEGKLVPSDGPGFGLGIEPEHLVPF